MHIRVERVRRHQYIARSKSAYEKGMVISVFGVAELYNIPDCHFFNAAQSAEKARAFIAYGEIIEKIDAAPCRGTGIRRNVIPAGISRIIHIRTAGIYAL